MCQLGSESTGGVFVWYLPCFSDEVVGREGVAVHDLDPELRSVAGDGEEEGLIPLRLAPCSCNK